MPVATVVGKGVANAPPEFVIIDVHIRGVGQTTTAATVAARTRMEKFYDVLRQLEHAGVSVNEPGLKTSFSVAQRYDTDRKVVSYEASFRAAVTSTAVDCAAEMFNLMCGVDGAEVSSPRFTISAGLQQSLKNDAFKGAVKVAKARFRFQCEVIGLDPDDLEVTSWHFDGPRYGASSAKMLHVGSDEVTVSGQAVQVECEVRLTYDRKGAAAAS